MKYITGAANGRRSSNAQTAVSAASSPTTIHIRACLRSLQRALGYAVPKLTQSLYVCAEPHRPARARAVATLSKAAQHAVTAPRTITSITCISTP